jgi:hypothetical protein
MMFFKYEISFLEYIILCVRVKCRNKFLMLLRFSSAPRESASQDLQPIWFLIIFENKRRHIAGT